MLELPNTRLLSLRDAGLADSAEETAETFEGNAVLKALHYARLSGMPTLADDSGIEVDALDGRPGVRTRRYAGPNATDEENNNKLLAELGGLGLSQKSERGAISACWCWPSLATVGSPRVETTYGTFEGRVALESRGDGGFGYDPIFEPDFEPVGGRTVGELTIEEKNEVSHRAQAARAMREKLLARGY